MSDEQEEAFARADAGHELFGKLLRPYSQSRKDAAELMGLQYPFLAPEDHARLQKTSRYPALKKDMAIVFWLCGLKDTMDLNEEDVKEGAWTPEKAFLQPVWALAEAMDWLNAQPWGNTSTKEFVIASGVMSTIIMDDFNSAFRLDIEGGGKAEKKRTDSPSHGGRKRGAESPAKPGTV